jgi:hypothetical protein
MEGRQGRLVSHAEVEHFLWRFGYSVEHVRDLLRDLPDPVDVDRAEQVLAKHEITIAGLMDRRGASP